MGSGFVEACLEYFDHNPERVINSLLEENLPPHLMELDRKTARKKTEAAPSATRSNVFDGDEFDVNSRDRLDMGRVHKGKHAMSKVAKNANALLEDKRDLDRFAKLVWSSKPELFCHFHRDSLESALKFTSGRDSRNQ